MDILLFLLGAMFIGIVCATVECVLGKEFAWTFWGICVAIIFLMGIKAKADTYYSFKFKTKDELKISVPANSYEEAYKKAYQECFQRLTKGEYPGESLGLEYIDICANGKVQ